MAEIDRSKRYDNPPKHARKGMQNKEEEKAHAASESAERKEGEHKGPSDKKPGEVGKLDKDKGPSTSKDGPEFGEVAERHKREVGDMHKRHAADRDAHHKAGEEMHGRHEEEARKTHERHRNELLEAAGEGGAERAEHAAGGEHVAAEKAEGAKGSEP